MSVILDITATGFNVGYKANDSYAMIQMIDRGFDYLYTSGERTKAKAVWVIGKHVHLDGIEAKFPNQLCLTAARITEIIGDTNLIVVTVDDKFIRQHSKHGIVSQQFGTTFSALFGNVEIDKTIPKQTKPYEYLIGTYNWKSIDANSTR